MKRVVLYRFVAIIPLLVLVSFLAFALLELAPGSAAQTILGDAATPARVASLEHELGLDRPFLLRYLEWIGGVLSGDFGTSLVNSRPVWPMVTSGLPVTLSLALGGLVVSLLIGIPAGTVAALRSGGPADRTVTVLSSTALAVPNFWVGMLLAFWIGRRLGFLPSGGYVPLMQDPGGWLESLVLPALALGLAASAAVTRQMRNALVEVLGRDYIKAASAKGVPRRTLLRRHALRNALTPVATVTGFQVATMLGGSFVIEKVFALRGLGSVVVPATLERDIPVLLAVIVVTALVVLLVNLVIDILYGVLNPKVRLS